MKNIIEEERVYYFLKKFAINPSLTNRSYSYLLQNIAIVLDYYELSNEFLRNILEIKNSFFHRLKESFSASFFVSILRDLTTNRKIGLISLSDYPLIRKYIYKIFETKDIISVVSVLTSLTIMNCNDKEIISQIISFLISRLKSFDIFIFSVTINPFCFYEIKNKDFWSLFQLKMKEVLNKYLSLKISRALLQGLFYLKNDIPEMIIDRENFDKIYNQFYFKIYTQNLQVTETFTERYTFRSFDAISFLFSLGYEISLEKIYEIYNIDLYIHNFDQVDLDKINYSNALNKIQSKAPIKYANAKSGDKKGLFIDIHGFSHYNVSHDGICRERKGGTILKERIMNNSNINYISFPYEDCKNISKIKGDLERLKGFVQFFKSKLKDLESIKKNY